MPTASTAVESGSIQTILSTALNGYIPGQLVLSAEFDNVTTDPNWLAYPGGEAELVLAAMGAAFPVGGCVRCWIVRKLDGANYEDAGGGTTLPPRPPDFCFFPANVATAQRLVAGTTQDDPSLRTTRFPLPPGKFKVLLYCPDGTVAWNALNNTLKILPRS